MNIFKSVFPAVILLAATFAAPAGAVTVTFDLGTVFSDGAVAPDGPAPYATVTLDDAGGTGQVDMTLSISGDVGDADLTQLYLNFDSNFSLANLNFTYSLGGSTGPAANAVSVGTDFFQSDGDGKYDIFFNFPTAEPNVSAGNVVIYSITSIDAITANSSNLLSAEGGGEGTFFAASKWQTTGPDGENSAWVGDGVPPSEVPVPAAVWLFGSGLVGLVGIARRRKSS